MDFSRPALALLAMIALTSGCDDTEPDRPYAQPAPGICSTLPYPELREPLGELTPFGANSRSQESLTPSGGVSCDAVLRKEMPGLEAESAVTLSLTAHGTAEAAIAEHDSLNLADDLGIRLGTGELGAGQAHWSFEAPTIEAPNGAHSLALRRGNLTVALTIRYPAIAYADATALQAAITRFVTGLFAVLPRESS